MGTAAALVVGGLSLAKGVGESNQAKSAARQTRREGETAIKNRKREIQELVAKQKIGYLQSGVELEGTAQTILQDSYTKGIEDVNAIKGAYNRSIKNQMTAARANLLGSIAKAGTSAFSAYSSFSSMGGEATGLANEIEESGGVTSSFRTYSMR